MILSQRQLWSSRRNILNKCEDLRLGHSPDNRSQDRESEEAYALAPRKWSIYASLHLSRKGAITDKSGSRNGEVSDVEIALT